MIRNTHEDLKSVWFSVDVPKGFIVVFLGFVLLKGEFLHSSIPFFLDVVESSVNVSFDFSLFAGKMSLFAFSFVFGDFSTGRGRCGGGSIGTGSGSSSSLKGEYVILWGWSTSE